VPETPSIPAAPPDDQHTILVVDDEAHVRRLLIKSFERSGYCVLSAADGEEAIRMTREHHPSLVLLDAEMPKVHGFEVCRQIKEDAATRDIAVVMLTAKAQDEDRARGLAAGADGYVVKPFSPRRLLEEVETRLRARAP
jgi:two-component system phosphate regulon response regulator PhoB